MLDIIHPYCIRSFVQAVGGLKISIPLLPPRPPPAWREPSAAEYAPPLPCPPPFPAWWLDPPDPGHAVPFWAGPCTRAWE